MNKGCILARALGGQMRGAATQATQCHRRGTATKQMPARRRAPLGCGPQALWLCCSLLTCYRYGRRSRLARGPGGQQQNVTFIHLQALTADSKAEGFRLPIAIMTVLLLSMVPAAIGETTPAPQPQLPPGVQIETHVTPGLATVGDPIRLEFHITMPAGYQASIPAIDKQIGDFSIFEFSPGPLIPEPGKSEKPASGIQTQAGAPIRHSACIIAAAYRTGTLTFPPIAILLRTPEGKQIGIASPPAKVEIQSILSAKDRDLKDLKKQAELPEPVRWGLWLALLSALGILGTVAWLMWKRRNRRAHSIPAAPPQDLLDMAEAELRRLLARDFPDNKQVKPFYVLLSDIVKRILEAGYGIHTAEQTTSEIMDALDLASGKNPEDMERIDSFLRRCDVVKFAKYIPSTTEHESAVKDALGILEISRKLVVSRQSPVVSAAGTVD
jgi:hypothetical protein